MTPLTRNHQHSNHILVRHRGRRLRDDRSRNPQGRPGLAACPAPAALRWMQSPARWADGMSNGAGEMSDRLLTVGEAAEMLRTSERFPRRLIAERRIRFTRVGRHVRIPESAIREFIAAGLVEPLTTTRKEGRRLMAETTIRQGPEAAVGPVPGTLSRAGRHRQARSADLPEQDRRRRLAHHEGSRDPAAATGSTPTQARSCSAPTRIPGSAITCSSRARTSFTAACSRITCGRLSATWTSARSARETSGGGARNASTPVKGRRDRSGRSPSPRHTGCCTAIMTTAVEDGLIRRNPCHIKGAGPRALRRAARGPGRDPGRAARQRARTVPGAAAPGDFRQPALR